MKNLNTLMVALVLCAIPAVAVGQNVSCEDCSHEVSVYMGEGGLIATADGAEMVTYVATCEGVTRTGELMADDDGMVRTLLTTDNGLGCHGDDEGNRFQLGPIMDGGWFWITDDMNSAVGNLVSQDVLDNETTMITSAGPTVTMTMGNGAVYLKETSTGRVGILPNILPVEEMEEEEANPCGFTGAGTSKSPYKRKDSGCSMGDGKTITLANYANSITGATTRVMDGDSVTRPGGTSDLKIMIDLWGNGTGHFITAADATGDDIVRGQPDVAGEKRGARYTGVTYAGTVGSGPSGAALPTSGTTAEAPAGIVLDNGATTTNLAIVSIGKKASYCDANNNHTATVKINANIGATEAALVTPSVVRHPTSGLAGSISFNVVCPARSANEGVELVPENPFPVE